MSDRSNRESASAAREAQDAIVSRPRGSKAGAVAEALRRYLGAETYDEHRRSKADKAEGEAEDEKRRGSR
jgi:hypothetical protein